MHFFRKMFFKNNHAFKLNKAALGYLTNRAYFSGGVCKSTNRLDGKVVILTGGNTGIGFETALDLAKRGAKMILACRNLEKANKAAAKIQILSNNEHIETELLDLSDLNSVREFSKRMNSKLNQLDLLINNAGIMMCPYWKTKQGFEMQFGTNHLGHYLLTNLLLELLKKPKTSRIITVSSRAHYGYLPTKNGFSMNWEDINWTKNYWSVAAYSQSKLANILFTKELASSLAGTNITAVCLHPGAVRTELMRYTGEGLFFWFPYFMKSIHYIYAVVSKSPKEGAQTTIHCAVADDIPKYNGYYFSDCEPKKPSINGMNRQDAKRLWDVSKEMVGL